MAYDPADGYAVLFGGYECTLQVCGPTLNDTWGFSQGVWTNLTATGSVAPPFSHGSQMVWDGADGYVLLVTTTNTTWGFVGGVWSQILTTAGPGPRSYPGLTYDAADGYVVLFGGASLNSPVGQTWSYRAGAWTRLNTSASPWNRYDMLFTYDAADGYSVLYGGAGTASGSPVTFNDTWKFLAGNWTRLPNAAGPSVYKGFDAFGYDPLTSSVIAVDDPTYSSNNYLWEFAGGNWSQVNGINQSSMPLFEAGAYDPVAGEYVFVSGGSWIYYDVPNWVSTYSLVNQTWAQLTAPPVIPSPSSSAGMVDDPADGGLLLTDGQTSILHVNDSWRYGVTRTTTNGCSPGGLVYDAADGYVLLYCGQTWKFQGGNWTQIHQYPYDAWPAIGVGAMAYDSTDRYVVLFGSASQNETWTWSAGNWTNVTSLSASAPSTRYTPAMVDDPADGYVVLFGGTNASGGFASLNDTWTFAAGKWTLDHTYRDPSPRTGDSMTFDSVGGYVLLFGGSAESTYEAPPQDTWAFVGGNWSDITPSLGPQPEGRSSALLAFDTASGQALLLGGWSYFPLPASEWFWGTPVAPGAPVISSFGVLPSGTDVNASVTLRATIVGGAPPYTFNYAGLPPGCTTHSTATLSCRPASAGAFTVSLHVTDSAGNSTDGALALNVNPRPALVDLAITPASLVVGQSLGVDAVFAGGTAPFSIVVTGLPPGCLVVTVAVFSCVPSAAGNFSIRVTESDSVGVSANGSGLVSVAAPPAVGPFEIAQFSVAPAEVTVGGTVVVSTTTTGGLLPLSFDYVGLPAGCTTLNVPAFFCTPTESGNFTVQAEVTDSTPLHRFATALLLVIAAGGPPVPAVPHIASFRVSPNEVSLGAAVQFYLNATGGTPPYAYAFSGLPPGCIANDSPNFTCVPTLAGQWGVGVTVTDSRGYFAQAITALTVVAPPSTPGTTPPAPTAAPTLSESALLVTVGLLAGILLAVLVVLVLRRRAN
jgi:hypothetical protein